MGFDALAAVPGFTVFSLLAKGLEPPEPPEIPDFSAPPPPERSARRIRRPEGLAESQLAARTSGLSQLAVPTSDLNIPDF